MATAPLQTRVRFARALTVCLVLVATFAFPATATEDPPSNGSPDGWSKVSPAQVGLDAKGLEAARTYAFAPGHNTQGVVVIRGGHLAAEWYAPGDGPRSWASSWSMAKSITSILIGVAIGEGKIAGVDESLSTWFPEWADTPKAAITLRDVLQMRTGLSTSEDFDPAHADTSTVLKMGRSADELAYAAGRPLVATPGTVFNYSSADAMLLSRVIQAATGMPADQYAQRKLFGPLGIKQVEWWRDAAGHPLTYCCVDTTTRTFARIGLLYLHKGKWHGRQVVPASWIHDSLTGSKESGGGYGYMWWIAGFKGIPGPVYMMNGHDGQFVYVIPDEDLVVARNGDYTKSTCPAIADPNLFGRYPSNGLVDGAGTRPPDGWNHGKFLKSIVDAVRGPPGAPVAPSAESAPASRDPDGQVMAPCPDPASVHSPLTESSNANPRSGRPTYTG